MALMVHWCLTAFSNGPRISVDTPGNWLLNAFVFIYPLSMGQSLASMGASVSNDQQQFHFTVLLFQAHPGRLKCPEDRRANIHFT